MTQPLTTRRQSVCRRALGCLREAVDPTEGGEETDRCGVDRDAGGIDHVAGNVSNDAGMGLHADICFRNIRRDLRKTISNGLANPGEGGRYFRKHNRPLLDPSRRDKTAQTARAQLHACGIPSRKSVAATDECNRLPRHAGAGPPQSSKQTVLKIVNARPAASMACKPFHGIERHWMSWKKPNEILFSESAANESHPRRQGRHSVMMPTPYDIRTNGKRINHAREDKPRKPRAIRPFWPESRAFIVIAGMM